MSAIHQGMQVLSNDDPDAPIHIAYMKLAIEQAEKSIPVPSGYCVGAVLVRKKNKDRSKDKSTQQQAAHKHASSTVASDHGTTTATTISSTTAASDDYELVATGYSRELPGNTHAEECCLLKLLHNDDENKKEEEKEEEHQLIMYSTMEPCSHRLSGNRPCSERLIASRVRTVYVGVREPDHFVQKVVGIEDMVEHGLTVVHIPGFEKACLAPNRHVLGDSLS
ncbi:hypothetical protein DFQ27_000370 [Actinomortierella ambigua]|uniref:CMP/dCMP-type deaminase domain-containing protein n=1 Tax=Actinomortierella ambigua TaxID=1343610 RepID=A0A9P6QCT9_9FUNG|nr:hypothetical protein DFQ27_000370 [Actinomortierella ambigua]